MATCSKCRAYKLTEQPCPVCGNRANLTLIIDPKCDHVWNGPEVRFVYGGSVSCSKCGMLAIDEAMKS